MNRHDAVKGHPDAGVLDAFVRSALPPVEMKRVVLHLLHGCRSCTAAVAPSASLLLPGGLAAHTSFTSLANLGAANVTDTSADEYDDAISRAFAVARRHEATAVRTAAPSPSTSSASPAALRRREPVSLAPAAERCRALLEASRTQRNDSPAAKVLLASLAVALAEAIPAEEGSAAVDLQALAWAELGNAHRVATDLPQAEAELARALGCAQRGSGDPLLLARIMDLTASLYSDQRRFSDADRLLDWVHAIYQANGEQHLAGRTLISKGITVGYDEDSEQAVQLLEAGLALVDPNRDPALVLAAMHNLSSFLVEAGRLQDGIRYLELARPLYALYADPVSSLKMRWLEGRIAEQRNDLAAAEAAFVESRNGFETEQRPYDAALVSLDLAALRLRQGRTRETRVLVEEILATFRAIQIRREAIATLLVLQRAIERERATRELVRAVALELKRFEPAFVQRLPPQR
ncbi:MAG TPA: hypothetical protein VGE98_01850 [Thermoanaerobaculia bacterium]